MRDLLRNYIRVILESSDKDAKASKKKSNLLLEPDEPDRTAKKKKSESSTVGGSLAGAPSEVISEPDMPADDGGGIDSGDGCEDVGDCKKDNQDNERKDLNLKREMSGAAAAGGGPAMPLGAGPHYPGPDSPAVERIRKQIDVVGRAYGGSKPAKNRKSNT